MKTELLNILRSRIVKVVGFYTIINVINSAIPFLLLPLLTRYLSPEEYGITSMFGVLISFVTPFIGLNVHGAITKAFYDKEAINISEYITNCIYILIISTIIMLLVFTLFSKSISGYFSLPTYILWYVIVISFSQFIIKIILVIWQVQVKPILYGIFQITQTLINFLLSIIFIVFIGLTWKGRVYAQLTTMVLYMFLSLGILLKNRMVNFKISFNSKYLKHALGFGIPLVPHVLGSVIMAVIDRLFITNMVGIEATGVYTVGYQIGVIIDLLSSSINQAYVPWLYSKLKENLDSVNLKIVRYTYLYFITILLIAISLSFITPWILSAFIGTDYGQSSNFVIWISIGYSFNGMYMMVVNYIFYENRNSLLAVITIFTALLNVIFNYFFIKLFGAIGAAQSTTLIYFLRFIIVWFVASKVHKMPWKIYNETSK